MILFFSYLLSIWFRVIEDVMDSNHLCHDGGIAEGVAYGCQPGDEAAQDLDCQEVCGGHHQQVDIHIQDESTSTNQVVQVGAAQLDQSGEETVDIKINV